MYIYIHIYIKRNKNKTNMDLSFKFWRRCRFTVTEGWLRRPKSGKLDFDGKEMVDISVCHVSNQK